MTDTTRSKASPTPSATTTTTPAPHTDPLAQLFHRHGLALTATQLDQLKKYRHLVTTWNPKQNMVAPSTLPEFDERHLLDSAQLVPLVPPVAQTLLDVGSGAGLPGLVLAILCPQIKITLAEIIQKKASFLTMTAYELGLKNVFVHAGDVRDLPPESFDVVTARAVANLSDLLDLSSAQLKPEGSWLLLKGQAAEQEINALEFSETLVITRHPSIVSGGGVILHIKRSNPSAA